MSLRIILFTVIGALAIMLLVIAGLSARHAWQQNRIADEVVSSSRVAALLLEGARRVLAERDNAYIAHRTDDKAAASKVLSHRGAVDAAINAAFKALTETDLIGADHGGLLDRAQDAHESLAASRVTLEVGAKAADTGTQPLHCKGLV